MTMVTGGYFRERKNVGGGFLAFFPPIFKEFTIEQDLKELIKPKTCPIIIAETKILIFNIKSNANRFNSVNKYGAKSVDLFDMKTRHHIRLIINIEFS